MWKVSKIDKISDPPMTILLNELPGATISEQQETTASGTIRFKSQLGVLFHPSGEAGKVKGGVHALVQRKHRVVRRGRKIARRDITGFRGPPQWGGQNTIRH
jgi:hypothetical protein